MSTILVGMASVEEFEAALLAVQKGPLPSAALHRAVELTSAFTGESRWDRAADQPAPGRPADGCPDVDGPGPRATRAGTAPTGPNDPTRPGSPETAWRGLSSPAEAISAGPGMGAWYIPAGGPLNGGCAQTNANQAFSYP